MEIRPVRDQEQMAASSLTVPGLPSAERLARRALERSSIDPRCQIVAVDGSTVFGACLYLLTAGRGATVLIPALSPRRSIADPEQVRRDLIRRAAAACREGGAVLIQALIEEAPDQIGGRRFLDAGFHFLAALDYLELQVNSATRAELDTHWDPQRYSPETEQQFARLIQETYEGSLDCPVLDGLRSPDDILASHKACGIFTPDGWVLARNEGEPAGLVLVNRLAERPACELVYMGVAPRFRGRGLGRWLIAKAVATARGLKCRTLTVAVDGGNAPARRLYEQAGFAAVGRRYAYYFPPVAPTA